MTKRKSQTLDVAYRGRLARFNKPSFQKFVSHLRKQNYEVKNIGIGYEIINNSLGDTFITPLSPKIRGRVMRHSRGEYHCVFEWDIIEILHKWMQGYDPSLPDFTAPNERDLTAEVSNG